MASNAQGEAMSGGSSSNTGKKNGGKAKAPKIKQRGMGVAQLEKLRIQSEMEAAAGLAANASAGGSMVPTNFHNVLAANSSAGSMVATNLHTVPVYQLLDEGPKVNDSLYLSSVLASIPPSLRRTPVTAPPAAGPQAVKESLSIFDYWKTSDRAPFSTPSGSNDPRKKKMSMAGEGSEIQLGRLCTRLDGKNDDGLEFQQPNYFTRLLLAEDEEETGQKNKKARTDNTSGEGSAAAGSSSSEELNLELRL